MNVKPRRRKKRKGGGFSWSTYWTQQYQDVLDYMTAQAIPLPSNTDKLYQAQWVKSMVDGGYWAKAEFLDLFATQEAQSLINWKAPGTRNPSATNSPVFEAYKGYTGDQTNTRGLDLNFIPATHGANLNIASFSLMIGNGTDLLEARTDVGANEGSSRAMWIQCFNGALTIFRPCSSALLSLYCNRAIGHIGFSVNEAGVAILQKNKFRRSKTFTPAASLTTGELLACGFNNGGLAASNKQLRYVFMFSGLTEAEMQSITDITETYLSHYSAGLIESGDTSHPILSSISEKIVIRGDATNPWTGRPFMIENDLGEWMVAYVKGATHSTLKTVHIRFSDDQGVTWSDEDKLVDNTAVTVPSLNAGSTDCGSGLLMKCPNGDIILTCWETGGTVGNYQWRSDDDGRTWTAEGRILGNTYLMEEDYCIVGSDMYVVVRSGTGANQNNYLYKSTDNGASWASASTIQSNATNPNEGGIEYLGSNTFISVVKDTGFLKTYQNISTDAGVNWTLSDITAQVGIINKPRLRLINGALYLFGRKYVALGIAYTGVWVSTNNGTTWSEVFTPDVYNYDDCGYCDMLARTDGSFYMLSYRGTTYEADLVEYVFDNA